MADLFAAAPKWTDLQSLLALIAMAAMLTLFYYMTLKGLEKAKPPRTETYTLLECSSCDFKDRRSFSKGDFVGKRVGACPKCSTGFLYISIIYSEAVKEEKGRGRSRAPAPGGPAAFSKP